MTVLRELSEGFSIDHISCAADGLCYVRTMRLKISDGILRRFPYVDDRRSAPKRIG
jgi:hypothetical protein